MPSQVLVTFHNYEEPDGPMPDALKRKVEAHAIDAATTARLVSLPLADMAQWLRNNGYRPVAFAGTSAGGVWVR